MHNEVNFTYWDGKNWNYNDSRIIYAKTGFFSQLNDQNFLVLNQGKILNINKGKTTVINFNKTQLNLSDYSSKKSILALKIIQIASAFGIFIFPVFLFLTYFFM